MQKKDDKVGNEDANKEERQSKKGEQEKEMEIDSKKKTTKKMSKFWLLRMREKQKSLLNYARLVGKYVFFLENSFSAILMLMSRKLVQRRDVGEKCCFFAAVRPSPRG